MKIRVEKNFGCNGIKVKKGEFLKKEQAEKIGKEFMADLSKKGFILDMDKKAEKKSDKKDDKK